MPTGFRYHAKGALRPPLRRVSCPRMGLRDRDRRGFSAAEPDVHQPRRKVPPLAAPVTLKDGEWRSITDADRQAAAVMITEPFRCWCMHPS
jgi:hypothetical protein